MRIRRAGLGHVRAPQHDEAGIVPVGALGHVGLLAPGHRRGRRQVAIPVVERHRDAADEREIAGAGGVGDHRHRRNGGKADDAVGTVAANGMDVGGGDDLLHLVPARPDEAAEPAGTGVGRALVGIVDDRCPGLDRRFPGRPRRPPQRDQLLADQGVLQARRRIEIPAVARPAGAAARLVIGQVGTRARIVGLLRLPGDDAALDIDLPRAGAGAVHPVGRAHDLVVLPALAVAVLPGAALVGRHPVSLGEGLGGLEKIQTVEQTTH